MVQTKARAMRPLTCYLSTTSEDSGPINNSGSSVWESMVKTSTVEVLSELRIRKVPDKQVACTTDGLWTDGKYHFITKAESTNDTFYYRDLTKCYSRFQPDAHPGLYDKFEFSVRFAYLAMNNPPYPLNDSFLNVEFTC